jgi:hypothetical protein
MTVLPFARLPIHVVLEQAKARLLGIEFSDKTATPVLPLLAAGTTAIAPGTAGPPLASLATHVALSDALIMASSTRV